MCDSLPSRHHIRETHIKVAHCQYILCRNSLSSNEPGLIFRTYGSRYMCAIDCPNTILHKLSKIMEQIIQKKFNIYYNSSPHITHLEKWRITWIVSDIWVHVTSSRRLDPFLVTAFKTLWKYLYTVQPDR